MSDELRAAAEIYVDRASGNHCPTHREQLMRAYLAGAGRYAPPADDAGPVTEEWLATTGLPPACQGFGVRVTGTLSLWDSRLGWGLYFHGGDGDAFEWGNGHTGAARVADASTRGAVRRLLAALGITPPQK